MPTISVVIPAYNAASTLSKAIESVLNQDIQGNPLELIIVDDGSTDGTSEIAARYVSTHPHCICLITQQNQGPSAARNAGIAAAAGKLIAFLDADDQWLPGKIAAQLSVFTQLPEIALVCTNMNNGRLWGKPNIVLLKFKDLLWSNKVYTSSVLAKKSALLAAGGFNSQRRLSEDYELWLSISAIQPIALINAPYLVYQKNSGTSSRLWAMERAELETYSIFYKKGLISSSTYTLLRYWSLAKFARRCALRHARAMSCAACKIILSPSCLIPH